MSTPHTNLQSSTSTALPLSTIHPAARVCSTASGWLVQDDRVLLVLHKKLKLWLAPGGHVDPNELPHHAVEREFWEETGIRVEAYTHPHFPQLQSQDSEYLPTPVYSNLHWVCPENYQVRCLGADKESVPAGWRAKGCEQHIVMGYLVRSVDPQAVDFFQNGEETLGIDWFRREDIAELKTTPGLRQEILKIFELIDQAK